RSQNTSLTRFTKLFADHLSKGEARRFNGILCFWEREACELWHRKHFGTDRNTQFNDFTPVKPCACLRFGADHTALWNVNVRALCKCRLEPQVTQRALSFSCRNPFKLRHSNFCARPQPKPPAHPAREQREN